MYTWDDFDKVVDVEDIVERERREFMEEHEAFMRRKSAVKMSVECRVENSKKKKGKKGRVYWTGKFVGEYPDYYLFQDRNGYREAFLKVDLVSGEKRVIYI